MYIMYSLGWAAFKPTWLQLPTGTGNVVAKSSGASRRIWQLYHAKPAWTSCAIASAASKTAQRRTGTSQHAPTVPFDGRRHAVWRWSGNVLGSDSKTIYATRLSRSSSRLVRSTLTTATAAAMVGASAAAASMRSLCRCNYLTICRLASPFHGL